MEGMRLKWTQAVCLPRFQPRVPFLAHVVLSPPPPPTSNPLTPKDWHRSAPFSVQCPHSPSFIIITQPILFIRMHLTITSPCLCIHIYFIFLFSEWDLSSSYVQRVPYISIPFAWTLLSYFLSFLVALHSPALCLLHTACSGNWSLYKLCTLHEF